MIFHWLKNWRNRADARRAEATAKMMNELELWRDRYFAGIRFPIVILDNSGYKAVSSIEEYFFDPEIHSIGITGETCGIDSAGSLFDFQAIEAARWVPKQKIGTESLERLKARLAPYLHIPAHVEKIDAAADIPSLMKLLASAS